MSSLISMIELGVRLLSDGGMPRHRAIPLVGMVGFAMGLPSAVSPSFFLNQDWVWGVGLMVSGALITFAVLRVGVQRFRQSYVNAAGSDVTVGQWYDSLVRFCIPVEVGALLAWWFWVAIRADPEGWWKPFRVESVGTCLFQWGVALIALLVLNPWLARKTLERE